MIINPDSPPKTITALQRELFGPTRQPASASPHPVPESVAPTLAQQETLSGLVFSAARTSAAEDLDTLFKISAQHATLSTAAHESLNLVLETAEPEDFIGVLQATARNADARILATPHIRRVLGIATARNIAAILPILKVAATDPDWRRAAAHTIDHIIPDLRHASHRSRADQSDRAALAEQITLYARADVPEYAAALERQAKNEAQIPPRTPLIFG